MQEPVILEARNCFSRMRGLLGRRDLPVGTALLISPCSAIHTVGMKFPIDVRFYNRSGDCVREILNVPPGRFWVGGGWRATCVLECGAGDETFRNFRLPAAAGNTRSRS